MVCCVWKEERRAVERGVNVPFCLSRLGPVGEEALSFVHDIHMDCGVKHHWVKMRKGEDEARVTAELKVEPGLSL